MINLDRLKSNLQTSGLQLKDNPLFQVINQLIDAVREFTVSTNTAITSGGSSSATLKNKTYITDTDESFDLPNSRQELAGTNVSFDDSIPNKRTINVSAASADYVVMSDGATPIPASVDDGFGNFIYIPYAA